MRRFLSLFTMLMLCGMLAFAQSRVVSGKVTDINGNPVSFATVKVKGTKTGLSADANGAYSIRVNSGDVLVISGASFKETEIPVGTQTYLNTVMEAANTAELKEVVVSGGYGIKRALRAATTNTQVVTAEQLNTTRNTNINEALAGKVSGIQLRGQSGAKLGSSGSGSVLLRGQSQLGGGSNILYVLDGTRVSADDINVDDVNDVTVLQGPAAAAIFGPDGSTGAIVITTKKAKKTGKPYNIELNLGVKFDNVYILPNYQNSYAGGDAYDMKLYTWEAGQPDAWKPLSGKYYPDYGEDVSWGPRMVGQEYIPWYAWYGGHERSYKSASLTPQPNNARDFYNTQSKLQNGITFSKATDNMNMRVTYTNIDVKGLIYSTWLKRNSLNANTSFDLSDKLSLGLNINYFNQKSNGDFNDGYANQSSGSFNQWFHRDLDMSIVRELKDLKTPAGYQTSWNHLGPDNYLASDGGKKMLRPYYWQNFYTAYDQVQQISNFNKFFGNASLTYKFNNAFKVQGTYRFVENFGRFEQKISSDLTDMTYQSQAAYGFVKGGYLSQTFKTHDQHIELTGIYNKTFRNFNVGATGGLDIHNYAAYNNTGQTFDGLNVPNVYSLSNSTGTPVVSDSRYLEKDNGLFISGTIGYRKFLNLDFTLRNDWLSMFPKDNNSILSKSVSGSFLFSEFFKGSFLSNGKLRGGWGETPQSLNQNGHNGSYKYPGSLYSSTANQWNGNFLEFTSSTQVDPNIHGAVSSMAEVGIDLGFFKNRLGFSVTYWRGKDVDFPRNIPITGTSGITNYLTNSGEMRRKGVDVQFTAKPLNFKNLTWDISATWGTVLDNKIVSIDKDPTNIASFTLQNAYSATYGVQLKATEGEQWGILVGRGIKRDADGNPLLNAPTSSNPDATYVYDDNVNFGSIIPQYTGGVQNSFTFYKHFSFNFNIDYQFGGKFFSVTEMFGNSTGVLAATAVLNDKGIAERDPVADGGGKHIFGVDAVTGKPVDYYVDVRGYWDYGRRTNDLWVRDLTYIKLREVGFTYDVPVSKLSIGKWLNKASFSILLSQPWLIYAKTKDFDPSEVSSQVGEGGQFPGTRGIGVNLKLGF